MKVIKLTDRNIQNEHICCIISDLVKKTEKYLDKTIE